MPIFSPFFLLSFICRFLLFSFLFFCLKMCAHPVLRAWNMEHKNPESLKIIYKLKRPGQTLMLVLVHISYL